MKRSKFKISPPRIEQVNAELLTVVSVFSRLTPNQRVCLVPYVHLRAYRTDETIYEQGDPPAAVFFPLSGAIVLYHQEEALRRDRIRTVSVGESCGRAALLPAAPQQESAVAAEPLQLLVLSHADFEMLTIRESAIATAILQGVLEETLEEMRKAFTAYRGLTNHLTAANIIV